MRTDCYIFPSTLHTLKLLSFSVKRPTRGTVSTLELRQKWKDTGDKRLPTLPDHSFGVDLDLTGHAGCDEALRTAETLRCAAEEIQIEVQARLEELQRMAKEQAVAEKARLEP